MATKPKATPAAKPDETASTDTAPSTDQAANTGNDNSASAATPDATTPPEQKPPVANESVTTGEASTSEADQPSDASTSDSPKAEPDEPASTEQVENPHSFTICNNSDIPLYDPATRKTVKSGGELLIKCTSAEQMAQSKRNFKSLAALRRGKVVFV